MDVLGFEKGFEVNEDEDWSATRWSGSGVADYRSVDG
jgi:hypothetical protein